MFRTRTALGKVCLLAGLLLGTSVALAADEFILKDGQKISGTLVGFENGMFRVETEFGYALIRKDKVATVSMTSSGANKITEKNSGRSNAAASEASGNAGHGAAGSAMRQESLVEPGPTSPLPHNVPTPPPSEPLNEPLPSHLQEHLEGISYVNDTFQFAMFKPPDWKLYEELHREKVSAIVALASQDDQTLLFVDRQVWSGPPDLSDDRIEANLRLTYENYKKLDETRSTVDGHEAIRRSFTGVIDGVEWHGVSVRFARGNTVFGIIGLTSAETYQFQEAIFNKVIKSFHFLNVPPGEAASAGTSPGR